MKGCWVTFLIRSSIAPSLHGETIAYLIRIVAVFRSKNIKVICFYFILLRKWSHIWWDKAYTVFWASRVDSIKKKQIDKKLQFTLFVIGPNSWNPQVCLHHTNAVRNFLKVWRVLTWQYCQNQITASELM